MSREGDGREGGGRREEGGGREIFVLHAMELLVSRVLECIEVEIATCALLYTTVPHCMGILTGRLDPIS